MTNKEVMEYHRHRFPYLLLDCADDVEPGKSARGHKCFSENEWLFHCYNVDDQPVPFTMVIEVLTEIFLMPIVIFDENKGRITNFLSADNVSLLKDVYPGDILDVEANIKSWKRGIAIGTARGFVDGELVCCADLKFTIPDILDQFKPRM